MKRKVFFLFLFALSIFALSATASLAADETELEVLELVNIERANNGLAPLQWSNDAYEAAQIRAEEVTQSFSHTRLDGSQFSTVFRQLGIDYSFAAENIAYGYTTAEDVVVGWMNSPSHRANILSPRVQYLGVAKVDGNGYSPAWAQEFFTPYGSYTPSEPTTPPVVTPRPTPTPPVIIKPTPTPVVVTPTPTDPPKDEPIPTDPPKDDPYDHNPPKDNPCDNNPPKDEPIPTDPPKDEPTEPADPWTPINPIDPPEESEPVYNPSDYPIYSISRYQPPEWGNSLQQYVPDSYLIVWFN